MSKESIKVAFGTAGALFTDENAPEIYKVLEEGGCKILDTAQLYSGKEEVIGRTGGAKKFIVDTKDVGGFVAKSATKDTIVQRGEESIKKLDTDQVCHYATVTTETNDIADRDRRSTSSTSTHRNARSPSKTPSPG